MLTFIHIISPLLKSPFSSRQAAGAAAANAAAIAADKAKQGWEKGRDAISSLTQETPRSATLADAPNSEAAAARSAPLCILHGFISYMVP